ncbi:unnamed protein product [Orchesella dallaii]|uniref:C2H2-type domain-containing protein n=1 Tax=Orchesella dallaii TaxID=48710 RepID=A0ABP1RUG8_9HEXA
MAFQPHIPKQAFHFYLRAANGLYSLGKMDNGKAGSKYNPTEAARRLLSVMSPSHREMLLLKWSEKGFINNEQSQESNSRNGPAVNQPTSSTSTSSTSSSQGRETVTDHVNPSNNLEHGDVEATMPNEGGSENDANEDLDDADIEVVSSQVSSTQNTASAQQKDITDCEDLEVILDDDVVPEKMPGMPKEMICYRCPNKEVGTFTNIEKFQFHVKRHITQGLFRCATVTCERPFTSINKCVAHEIAEHETKFPRRLLNNRNPVIVRAKNYVKEKVTKRAEGQVSVSGEYGDETFDDSQIQGSTCLTMYQGPPVSHQMEQYEIWVNHARPKFQSGIKTACAHKALAEHQEAVEQKKDTNKLVGNFSKRKGQRYHYTEKEKSKPGNSSKRGRRRKRGQKLKKPPTAQKDTQIE